MNGTCSRFTRMALAGLCALGALPALIPQRAEAAFSVSFDIFFDELRPHGRWFHHERYGRCWEPYGVASDWRPYWDGYWVYTDHGWTWVTDEPWGWATYHYGRWVLLDDEWGPPRWVWVPGYEWAPAWVSWRYSDNYVGWAPLPPEARWDRHGGLGVWVDVRFRIGADHYNFCDTRHFGSRNLRPVIYRPDRNRTIINNTVNVTQIVYNDNRIVNRGPDIERVNRRAERRVERLHLERRADLDRGSRVRRERDSLQIFSPEITKQPVTTQAAPPSERVRRQRREAVAPEPTQIERNLEQGRKFTDEQRSAVRQKRESAAAPQQRRQPREQERIERRQQRIESAPEPRRIEQEQPRPERQQQPRLERRERRVERAPEPPPRVERSERRQERMERQEQAPQPREQQFGGRGQPVERKEKRRD